MFEKKFVSLKHLNYLYLFVNLLSYALILGVMAFIINDCYHLYLRENNIFQQSKVAVNSTTHLDVFLKNLLWGFLIGLGKIGAYVITIIVVKFLIFKTPLTSHYLITLDKNKEISPILGRFISYHFRRNISINFSTLVLFTQEAEYEQYIIQSHAKKNKFEYFLNKYDSSYQSDLNH